MTLLVALAVVVLLGLLGPLVASTLAQDFGLGSGFVLVALYVLALGAALLFRRRIRAHRSPADDEVGPDDPWSIGTLRGSKPLEPLLVLTLVAAALGLLAGGADLLPTVLLLATLLGGWFARPVLEDAWRAAPLIVRPTVGPDESPSARLGVESSDHLPDPADREVREYAWTFSAGLDKASSQPRNYALALVCSKTRSAEQAAVDESAASPGVLVRDGLVPEVRRCAGLLAKKAAVAGLPYFDTIDFVLAFVGAAVPTPPESGTASQAPLKTLVSRQGTSADAAVLAAALLASMGFDPLLVELRLEQGERRLGVGVPLVEAASKPSAALLQVEERTFYYAEAGRPGGWHLGEVPARYRPRLCEAVPIGLS